VDDRSYYGGSMRRRYLIQTIVEDEAELPVTDGLKIHLVGENYNSSSGIWEDISGNDNDLQTMSGYSSPAKTNENSSFNDLASVDFGSGKLLVLESAPLTNSNVNCTIFIVGKANSTGSHFLINEHKKNTTSNIQWTSIRFNTTGYIFQQRAEGSNTKQAQSGTPGTDTVLSTGIINGTTAIYRLNGSQIASHTQSLTGTLVHDRFLVGGFITYYISATNYFDGSIAEIICYDRALNSTEIEDVEEYLMNKYGM